MAYNLPLRQEDKLKVFENINWGKYFDLKVYQIINKPIFICREHHVYSIDILKIVVHIMRGSDISTVTVVIALK